MKRRISVLLALCFSILATLITACGKAGSAQETGNRRNAGTLSIVATIFPEYDWLMNVLGNNPASAEVTLLCGSGVDLHSYQPSVDDVLKIADCDLFIYVGGESDRWVKDALGNAVNGDMVVIDLLDCLGSRARQEETTEGMQEEEHWDDHEDDHGHEHDHEDEDSYDEHVWLSLRNAAVCTEAIRDALCELDQEHASVYADNAAEYISRLDALDHEYREAVDAAETRTLLFADRFPFRYLTDDYGLAYFAAFPGCSAETEASFETVTFLSRKTAELSLQCILTTEGSDQKLARTVMENAGSPDLKILTMDSMQSVSAKEIADGASYLSIMEKNLDVLKQALE
ncbi:MAG: zinc ABC transporter substrate-binding protein [Lachnospiraceae bacterium]|nr:zinc ABC transporter substrate-binding protein [Lachnospiraceae bacterium]